MSQQVEVQHLTVDQGLTVGDVADLGVDLHAAGILEARALIAEMQQLGVQMALATAPKILNRIQEIQAARVRQMLYEVRLLPNKMGLGYVHRDSVLQIIQRVAIAPPRM